jgi:hypothetical protein
MAADAMPEFLVASALSLDDIARLHDRLIDRIDIAKELTREEMSLLDRSGPPD